MYRAPRTPWPLSLQRFAFILRLQNTRREIALFRRCFVLSQKPIPRTSVRENSMCGFVRERVHSNNARARKYVRVFRSCPSINIVIPFISDSQYFHRTVYRFDEHSSGFASLRSIFIVIFFVEFRHSPVSICGFITVTESPLLESCHFSMNGTELESELKFKGMKHRDYYAFLFFVIDRRRVKACHAER